MRSGGWATILRIEIGDEAMYRKIKDLRRKIQLSRQTINLSTCCLEQLESRQLAKRSRWGVS